MSHGGTRTAFGPRGGGSGSPSRAEATIFRGMGDDVPLTEVEMAVIDAALAEELAEELGFLDEPWLMRRYRAQVRRRGGADNALPVGTGPA